MFSPFGGGGEGEGGAIWGVYYFGALQDPKNLHRQNQHTLEETV